MNLENTSYVSPNSNIKVTILEVKSQNDTHIKVNAILSNPKNGVIYELNTYNLLKSNIQHWVKE